MSKPFIYFLLLLLPIAAHGQITSIRGVVSDAETGEPLPFCNVFISNSTFGTTTDANGKYALINVPDGELEIAFSFVGYNSKQQLMQLSKGDQAEVLIALEPLKQQLSEVSIKASRDKEWSKQLKKFEKAFLGEGRLASSCEISNPWIIDFIEDKEEKAFTASAVQPIEIRNRSLGYYLSFDLNEFVYTPKFHKIAGAVQFSEMETTDPALASVWNKNRQDIYHRSPEYLFKSIATKNHNEAGFYLYTDIPKSGGQVNFRGNSFLNELGKTVKEYEPEKLVEKDSVNGGYKIYFEGRIEVHDQKEFKQANSYQDAPYLISWIEVKNGILYLNDEFIIQNPGDVIYSGEMDNRRVANMLPLDYNPASKVLTKGKVVVSNAERLYEKVYLHTDRQYYYAGDQLLFKAYMGYNTPALRDSLSKVLYVDLIGADKKIQFTKKYRIENGMSVGDFILPDTLSQAGYYLRAYTQWMRNYGSENFFLKKLPVLNPKQRYVREYDPTEDRQSEEIKVEITPDRDTLGKREKVSVSITIKDEQGTPVSANLSVSATSTYFFNPAYTDATLLETMSKDASFDTKPNEIFKYPIEKNLTVNGIFFGDKKKPTATPFKAFVDNFQGELDLETDKNGFFELLDLHFYGSMDIALQAKDKKGRNFGYFELYKSNNPFIDAQKPQTNQHIVNTGQPIYLSDFDLESQILEEVTISSKKEVEYRDNIYGKPDYVVTSEQLFTSSGVAEDLINSLRANVPGMTITTGYDGQRYSQKIRIRGGSTSFLLSMEPMVIINGVPSPNTPGMNAADHIAMVNPAEIDRIEVVSRMNSVVGDLGRNGVISIILKNKTDRDYGMKMPSEPGLSTFEIEGFSLPSVISHPDYDNDPQESFPPFDQRPTLYWNPYLATDSETGALQVEFFSNDLLSPIYIVVEGITNTGKPVRGTYIFSGN